MYWCPHTFFFNDYEIQDNSMETLNMKRYSKGMISITLIGLLLLGMLTCLTGAVGEPSQTASAPELEKGQKWSQSMEVDFGGIIDTLELDKNLNEMGKELKTQGFVDTFDIDMDIDGGLGLALTTEIVDVNTDFNGKTCHHIRNSAYFASGLGADASVNVGGKDIQVKGSGGAEYYVELDIVADMWVTADELAIMRIDVTVRPEISAEVKADAAGTVKNVNFDIDVNGYVRSSDIVARVTIDFDEPFDYLDLPIEENEEWTAEGSFTGTASISGKIETRLDVTGIPDEDDIHEGETIDLAEESGGPEELDEDISVSFESGTKSTVKLPDGTSTEVIPVMNVEIMELIEEIFGGNDDDYYDDYYYNDQEEVNIMKFSLQDGFNSAENPDTVGCFFLIRAEKSVDIDPSEYTFWVSEDGYSPKKLDFSFRDYTQDENMTPLGGDRNASYRYDDMIRQGRWPDMPKETSYERWTDGEYIGFDMPEDSMAIDVISGNKYEVIMKDPNNEIVYRDVFIYKGSNTRGGNGDDSGDGYLIKIGPYVDGYGDGIPGVYVSFTYEGRTYVEITKSDGTAYFEDFPVETLPGDLGVSSQYDDQMITVHYQDIEGALYGFDQYEYDNNYYYEDDDDDYYEEDMMTSILGGIFEDMELFDELGEFSSEDFEFKTYFAPEHGVFVKSDVGITETALSGISDPNAKKTLTTLNMEMEPATESEVQSFKDSRDKDYFVPEKAGKEVNWLLIGLGILAVVVIIIVALVVILGKRSGKKSSKGPAATGGSARTDDPYAMPLPPEPPEDSQVHRFPPPPEY